MYSQKTEMVDKQLIARIDVHLEVVRELKVRSGLKERSYFRFFRFLFFSAYCRHRLIWDTRPFIMGKQTADEGKQNRRLREGNIIRDAVPKPLEFSAFVLPGE